MTTARGIRHTTTGKCVSSSKVAAGTKQYDASVITLPCRERLDSFRPYIRSHKYSKSQRPPPPPPTTSRKRYCSSHKPRETQKRLPVEGDGQRQKDRPDRRRQQMTCSNDGADSTAPQRSSHDVETLPATTEAYSGWVGSCAAVDLVMMIVMRMMRMMDRRR